MLGTEVSKYRKTSQVKARMVDIPAGPLASLPGAPLAAFQPETAWTPPGHVMPAPAAARSIFVHADWHVVLQQTMIVSRDACTATSPGGSYRMTCILCNGSKAYTPDGWHCQWL